MRDAIYVWPPGTEVLVGGDIPGRIVDVSITDGQQVRYRVAYWDARQRKDEWMHKFEVTPAARVDQVQIGFKPAVPPPPAPASR